MKTRSNTVGARLRVVLGPGAAIGPGQAAILEVMRKGGRSGGSAVLTPLGEEVLMRYRRMEKLTAKAIDGEIKALKTTLNQKSGR